MRCSDVQLEWRIEAVERTADEASRRLYELDTLSSSVDSLERTVRELGSVVDELRYELQAAQETIRQLQEAGYG